MYTMWYNIYRKWGEKVITIEKVDMSLGTAYQLNELGLTIRVKDGKVLIGKEV